MSGLFDNKTAQAEDGGTALSKVTAREYDCQIMKIACGQQIDLIANLRCK